MRWSRGALGRVPRLAHRRVIMFFWPTRASWANQISIVWHRRLAVQEAVRAALVEVQYPVPGDLKPDAADFRCLGARRTVVDRRQRKKPTGLRAFQSSVYQATLAEPNQKTAEVSIEVCKID